MTMSHGSIIPSTAGSAPVPPAYLPPFHFAPPELAAKNLFLPYDLSGPRGPLNGHVMHSLSHDNNSTGSLTHPSKLTPSTPSHVNSSRLSPASSPPSSSSPQSSMHSVKMSITIDVQSTHDESEDSDDEQIDVVKSAFVPILRPSPKHTHSVVGIPDSTVHEPIVERTRCELKAPSSRKPLHETAPTGPRSPETKIKSPISAQKTVWRPY